MKIIISFILTFLSICPVYAYSLAYYSGIMCEVKTEKGEKDSTDKKKELVKPFEEVITAKAKTFKGFFTIHLLDDRYYMEIPDSLLGRDIMVVNRIVKAPADKQKRAVGYPGDHISDEVLRFQKGKGNKIFVRQVSYYEHSSDTLGLYRAVLNSNVQPIVASFALKAIRKEEYRYNYLIDLTDFINKDNELFSFDKDSKDAAGIGTMVSEASYIDTLKAYPLNIEIKTTKTFNRKKSTSPLSGILAMLFGGSAHTPLTYELNSSLILLPSKPMKARYFDPRVGYFAVSHTDFDANPHGVQRQAFITRWRMEPKPEDREKYLGGELVEPQKPIIIYIDPATPKKWVPYLIQGVNDWQRAFEKAGFKNAIIAKEVSADDTEWSLEDARHSAIVYKPSDIPNASGPHIHDPRSGEILETHINWYHNVMQLLHNWYVVQAGAIDTGARKPRFDDELMGQLIRFVSSHEVGHTLGLRHNFGSSHTVPVEKLRDKAWVEANGHAPSIMDYARFNYVAQPEDSISRPGIFPRIGMYDTWAIEWGYRWLPEYNSPDEERPYMNKWVIEKLNSDIRYTFGTELDRDDPRNQSEDLGDDAVKAGSYGIRNLKRIVPEIIAWTSEANKNHNNAVLLYQSVTDQFALYMKHAATNIAGIYHNSITAEQLDVKVEEYVPRHIQKESMSFLNRELFSFPGWLEDRNLEDRTGIKTFNSIVAVQASILRRLLNTRTLDKMMANEASNGKEAYTVEEFFSDLDGEIWKSLRGAKNPQTSERLLQKVYLNSLAAMLEKPLDASNRNNFSLSRNSEASTLALARLTRLRKLLYKAAKHSSGVVKAHYENLILMIDNSIPSKMRK